MSFFIRYLFLRVPVTRGREYENKGRMSGDDGQLVSLRVPGLRSVADWLLFLALLLLYTSPQFGPRSSNGGDLLKSAFCGVREERL